MIKKTKNIKVKILGAGSIGNHLAQAARRLDWDVCVVDRDVEALRRMREEIYPQRYGAWDEKIKLFAVGLEPKGGFDLICVGTPPDVRMRVALEILKEKPRILQLEKPLGVPSKQGMAELDKFLKEYKKQKQTAVLVGYDHSVSQSIKEVLELLKNKQIGEILTLDVEFREYWGGIFKAHPWLAGPQDSYLGFWQRGGGASGEHSHALHLWYFLAKEAGIGKVEKINAALQMVQNKLVDYDAVCALTFKTDQGKIGRVVQDVITSPVKKRAYLQGKEGFVEWLCNGHLEGDLVRYSIKGQIKEKIFKKKRPDDFYMEMSHIKDILEKKILASKSPLSFESGLEVMRTLAWVHQKGI